MVSVVELKRLLQECVKHTAQILHFFLCSPAVCMAKLRQQVLFLYLAAFKAHPDLQTEGASTGSCKQPPSQASTELT